MNTNYTEHTLTVARNPTVGTTVECGGGKSHRVVTAVTTDKVHYDLVFNNGARLALTVNMQTWSDLTLFSASRQ